jgi:hypothetical protein
MRINLLFLKSDEFYKKQELKKVQTISRDFFVAWCLSVSHPAIVLSSIPISLDSPFLETPKYQRARVSLSANVCAGI